MEIGHKKGTKQKMLIAGVGESQEPFSYLATIKSLCPDKKLTEVLDLKTVDLQSKPSSQQLFSDSYFEYRYQPDYAQSSFVTDIRPSIKYPSIYSYYRVNDEIFNFLDDTYKNNSAYNRLNSSHKKVVSDYANLVYENSKLIEEIKQLKDKENKIYRCKYCEAQAKK